MPTNWKLILAYDGSRYSGWQVQPGLTTVQGELAAAIHRVTGETVLPQGSGRTDAGVHAVAQVASVALHSSIPPGNLVRALNHALPAAVRVLEAEPVAADFHARHAALRKTYEYRLYRAPLCPPWVAPYVCVYTFPLAVERMQHAASCVLGTHDFRSFQAQRPDLAERTALSSWGAWGPASTTRTIFHSQWSQESSELLVYRVTGSGFLHHMVRNLVGTYLQIGRGLKDAFAMEGILQAKDRAAAGPTAPASGLWLHSVEYP